MIIWVVATHIFFYVHPENWGKISNWTSIFFFRWVWKPPTRWMFDEKRLDECFECWKTCGWTWGFTHVDVDISGGAKEMDGRYTIYIYIYVFYLYFISIFCIYIESIPESSFQSHESPNYWGCSISCLLVYRCFRQPTFCLHCVSIAFFSAPQGDSQHGSSGSLVFVVLCGQKLLLFLESTLLSKRASGMEAAFFLPTVIRRQVFDGVCFSKAVGRCQNALKFLSRWKQCFSQDRTWDAIHVIRDSNTSDVTIPFLTFSCPRAWWDGRIPEASCCIICPKCWLAYFDSRFCWEKDISQ